MNKTTRTSRAESNTYNSNFNADTPLWSEASISEDKDIGMRKGRRKSNVDNTNEEMKGRSSEEEEIKISKCNRKSYVETINEETKERSSEEKEIGIRQCRIRSRVDNMNEELKRWKSSLKKQESPPEITKTKEEICLEQTKRKLKRSDLEWNYFVFQEQLKYLMYVDRSLRGDQMKDKLIL